MHWEIVHKGLVKISFLCDKQIKDCNHCFVFFKSVWIALQNHRLCPLDGSVVFLKQHDSIPLSYINVLTISKCLSIHPQYLVCGFKHDPAHDVNTIRDFSVDLPKSNFLLFGSSKKLYEDEHFLQCDDDEEVKAVVHQWLRHT